MKNVSLKSAGLCAHIDPLRGGSVAGLQNLDGTCMFEPAATASSGMSCFPLAPFSNCIGWGRFPWGGRTIDLGPFGPEEPDHALHGFAWTSPMQVDHATETKVTLVQRCNRTGTPFDYRLRLDYALDETGLCASMEIRNVGREVMPGGLGFHPCFRIGAGSRLFAGPLDLWTNGPDRLPASTGKADPAITHGAADLSEVVIDNAHGGWGGTARLTRPDLTCDVVIRSDLGWLVVYRPPGAGWICIEPVSHLTDALNRPNPVAFGMRTLAPGEEMEARMRIDLVSRA